MTTINPRPSQSSTTSSYDDVSGCLGQVACATAPSAPPRRGSRLSAGTDKSAGRERRQRVPLSSAQMSPVCCTAPRLCGRVSASLAGGHLHFCACALAEREPKV